MLTELDRLIEAVARAIIAAGYRYNPATASDIARAAILATLRGIREPTLEMCNAGIPINCTGLPTGDWREGICAAPNCSCYEKHGMRIVPATYRAMIDRLIQDITPEGKGEG